MIRIAHDMTDRRQRLVTFLGQILSHVLLLHKDTLHRRMTAMRERQKVVTFLGQILPRMQLLHVIHIARDTHDRQKTEKSWSHFWGKCDPTCSCHVSTHDSHEAQTRVGHIFWAIASHAGVTYDTYCT